MSTQDPLLVATFFAVFCFVGIYGVCFLRYLQRRLRTFSRRWYPYVYDDSIVDFQYGPGTPEVFREFPNLNKVRKAYRRKLWLRVSAIFGFILMWFAFGGLLLEILFRAPTLSVFG